MIIYQSLYNNAEEVGGKANGLYKLRSAGYNVPDFFVITASTFKQFIKSHNADQLAVSMLQFELSDEDKSTISSILTKWNFPGTKLVVRSSITDEDGSNHSFAGMMDSFLHVDSAPSLFEKINVVAASAYSERAIAYRREKGIKEDALPAVIVQMEVAAIKSGVMFSTWPQYPQELAIHIVNGFGDKLMHGEVQADEYYLTRKNGVLNRQITHADGASVELNNEELQQLYNAAIKLEKQMLHPQDIEFVFSYQGLYIVQSRPITQSIPAVIVYDNSNIQESYCGVTTPLTYSFAQKAYATVYNQTMQSLHLPEGQIAANQDVVNNLLGLVKGRIYYNINNWYKGLQLLPSFRQNKKDMERMMGVQEPVDFVEDRELNFFQKVKLVPVLIKNLFHLLLAFRNLKNTVPAFLENFQKQYNLFYSKERIIDDAGILPAKEDKGYQLLKQLDFLDKNLLQQWSTPIVNDFYVMMSNGTVQRLLNKAGITDSNSFISYYLSGSQDIASAQPAIAMQTLAVEAVMNIHLAELILHLPADIHLQVEKSYPEFFVQVKKYIELYGDRTIGELKLETVTMREEPYVLYKYLRNTVDASGAGNDGEASILRADAVNQLDNLLGAGKSALKSRIYKSLDRLKKGIQYREAMRLERTRLFGMYRRVFLSAGNWLRSNNIIENERDVFYLTFDELKMYLTIKPADEKVKMLISRRKEEFSAYELLEVASRVEIPSPPTHSVADETTNADVLRGTGCVPGKVTGEAIVITNTSDNLNVHGKIIVAERTDPGWAVLFPSCKAVLISKGSSLSHSVILLREFGIPAVINIPRLTKRIKTGMTLTVDGESGEIQIIDHEEN